MREDFPVFAPRIIDQKEYFSCGHRACQGCGEALAIRLVLKATGKNVIVANATGCSEIISSCFPQSAWEIPWIHIAFENTAAVASGIERALKVLNRKGKHSKKLPKVLGFAGDGGTADIGLQALSGTFERGDNVLYVCYDNEAYMNTGVQRSGATPYGAWTTTSPSGKKSIGQRTWKKDMVKIAIAHNIPYAATACPSYPFDLINKVKKAVNIEGPSYIHILSPCPTGWRCDSSLTIKMGRLAVQTGIFPLYEYEDEKYKLTYDISLLKPVKDYLKSQGRFRHLKDADLEKIQERVIHEWEKLKKKVEYTNL